jgi:CDP-Glycerol:Poly(glycerophosphate) glycerophosphotransferase/Glycosyl transferase family 2
MPKTAIYERPEKRIGHIVRRVAHRLGPMWSGLRQRAGQLTRRRSSDAFALEPVLTVVFVATNAECYLSECLDSLRAQTFQRIEVIVVDNWATDGTAMVAEQFAAEDSRFQILLRPRLGSTASWNAGARMARGRLLAFMDATDTVPRTAYATLISSLRQTGSDFAAGAVRTVIRGRRRRPLWTVLTHDLDRPALTLDEFPLAVHDACATNRVFRRQFWKLAVGGFPESANGDVFAITSATLLARGFDLLQAVTCTQHARLHPGQLLPDPPTVSELDSRLHRLWASWQLARDADETIAGAFLGRLIDTELGDFAEQAHLTDALGRARLQRAAIDCLAIADDSVWPHVRVDRKLRLRLIANGRWADLEQLIQHVRLYGSMPRTIVREGHVYAVAQELPGVAEAPPACLELAESQTALSDCIEHIAWHGERLDVHGWAFIRGLDLASEPPQLTASLVESVTGLSYPCEVTQLHRVAANEWSTFRHQGVAPGGFVIGIDTQRIAGKSGRCQLRVTVRAHGLERTGPIPAVALGGTGHLMWGRNLWGFDDPNRVLSQLGIDLNRIVVLYAPTWGDSGATSPWSARLFDGLDLEALVEQLGERYAVLLRGHNYNIREGFSPLAGRVWDVSAYPEINDLLLAADVAVLDYSSIRFDWLISGKQVVFFVPDLQEYLSSRKVLFDFPSTAPGPHLATTAEVANALLDLGSVNSEYAAARELFNKESNRLHDGQATERVINAFF